MYIVPGTAFGNAMDATHERAKSTLTKMDLNVKQMNLGMTSATFYV
jgi:hypothetical protein